MNRTDLLKLKIDLPESGLGNWRIKRFTVTEEDAKLFNLRAAFSFSSSGRTITPGTYTKLTRGGATIMSDTPSEIGDHLHFVYQAEGDILLNGLGLGWVLLACSQKPEVKHITVVEIDKDVIELVGKHYIEKLNGKLEIICADALKWKAPKGKKYTCVWNDIWDDICGDNLETMSTLHRKYGRRAGYVGSWCRYKCKRLKGRY